MISYTCLLLTEHTVKTIIMWKSVQCCVWGPVVSLGAVEMLPLITPDARSDLYKYYTYNSPDLVLWNYFLYIVLSFLAPFLLLFRLIELLNLYFSKNCLNVEQVNCNVILFGFAVSTNTKIPKRHIKSHISFKS